MHSTTRASGLVHHLLAAQLTAVMTVVAVFLLGRASPSAELHALYVGATLGAATLAIWFGLRHEPRLRAWAVGGVVVPMVVLLAVGGIRSQPSVIDEDVVTAGPAMAMEGDDAMAGDAMERDGAMAGDAMERDGAMAGGDAMAREGAMEQAERNVLVSSGAFQPLEHEGRGTASIIRTADGRNVLTLTGFRTDPGPDLDVRLVAGNPSSDRDVERGRVVRLGKLKATEGDQQYVLPASVDPSEFTHAYVWCRAFSVGFTRARLG